MKVNGLVVGAATATALLLSACEVHETTPVTNDSSAVERRAIEAQTAQRRTGAELQENAMNQTIRAMYICTNSTRLTVDFDNPRRMATVRTSDGLAHDLMQQQAASGIWYRSGTVELRGKGNTATWQTDSTNTTDCRAID